MTDQPADHLRAFLKSLGLDASVDDQLADTPERVTELFGELFAGLHTDPPSPSTFAPPKTHEDPDPVVIAALPFQSMCAHHLLPFFGTVDVAYLPAEQMVGFGSIARIVDHFARRPQVQERMIAQIAEHIEETLNPRGVLVRLRARQLCMEMRGAEKTGELISIAGRGQLADGSLRGQLLDEFNRAGPSL